MSEFSNTYMAAVSIDLVHGWDQSTVISGKSTIQVKYQQCNNGWFVNRAKVNIKEELSIKERSISKSLRLNSH